MPASTNAPRQHKRPRPRLGRLTRIRLFAPPARNQPAALIYVDYHSLFLTQDPDALTQLGWVLKFYDISLRYAPTPQAKGKIEREHQFWRGRLPAYFASEKIDEIHIASTDGRVPIGTQRLRVEKPPGTKVVLCLHSTGHHSILAAPPLASEKTVLQFTNRPK